MSIPPHRYQIPTHLGTPDKLDTLSLTMRQALCFLLGWSLAFHLWQRTLGLSAFGLFGVLAHWVAPLLLAFATYVLAIHEVRGRPLEHWAWVWLRYRRLPKVFVWQSVITHEALTPDEDLDELLPGETPLHDDVLENEENE